MSQVDVKTYLRNYKRTLKHHPRKRVHDELKWWRVVRYWAKRKWGISTEDLELILFLYSEDLFTRKEFSNFNGILTWDKERLNEFINKGLVVVWREHKGYKQRSKLYTLSLKAKRMCAEVYKKLHQEESISEHHQNNPIFKGVNYTDKRYRKIIKMMNKKRDDLLK